MSVEKEDEINKIFLTIINDHEWIYVPEKKIMDESKKSEEWGKIREILNSSGININDPKEKWRKMRESFVRKHKNGKDRQLRYFNEIQFLIPFIRHKNDFHSTVPVNSFNHRYNPPIPSHSEIDYTNFVIETIPQNDGDVPMDDEVVIEDMPENVVMTENFTPSTNTESAQNSFSFENGRHLQTLASSVAPSTTFQILGQSLKTSPASTLQHLNVLNSANFSQNSSTLEKMSPIYTSHNSMLSPPLTDVSNDSSNDFLPLSTLFEKTSSGSAFSISKTPIKPVSISMFTKKDDKKKESVEATTSSSSIGQSTKSKKFSGIAKFTQKVVPPLDEFASRKKKKEDDAKSVAFEAMSEISKTMTNVSTKLNDYIDLKSKLLTSQIKGENSDGLFNIISREFSNLSLNEQRQVLPVILDEIENFIGGNEKV